MAYWFIVLVLMLGAVNTENSTVSENLESDTCTAADFGPFSMALENWALATPSGRHGRIMILPPSKGYYVTERIDTPYLMPPPPPSKPHFTPMHYPNVSNKTQTLNPDQKLSKLGLAPQKPGKLVSNKDLSLNSQEVSPGPGNEERVSSYPGYNKYNTHAQQGYQEWEMHGPPTVSKIVNRPPKPQPDKYKPNYGNQVVQTGQGGQPIHNQRPVDRVDENPQKQVSETDLYLLGAIEKLVYRADLMEKRLRRLEDSVHRLIANADGSNVKEEPCLDSFTRVGSSCYWWGQGQGQGQILDWKSAAQQCRKRGAALLELVDGAQTRVVYSTLLTHPDLKGNDFWTGGLNPGLLWIWSHSAKPVETNSTTTTPTTTNSATTVQGTGRCLALVLDPTTHSYVYRGRDCSANLRFMCQKNEDKEKISNEVDRISRKLVQEGRTSKLLWSSRL